MRITVCSVGPLLNYLGESQIEVEVAEGAAVEEALAQLSLPAGLSITIFINDRQAIATDHLREGDALVLVPAAAGGEQGPFSV